MIKRAIFAKLDVRYLDKNRKPVLLKGARQVGKSFAVEAYGRLYNHTVHTVNFMFNKQIHSIFEGDLDPSNLLKKIEYSIGHSINIEKDILFFDEIQECPLALTACKAFHELLPELHIIYAGSYVGLMQENISYPVGKLSYMHMAPLTFSEFLQSTNDSLYIFYEEINITEKKSIDTFFHKELLKAYRLYLTIGGMPEIVQTYITLGNSPELSVLQKIRNMQQQLLDNYKGDFSKHAGRIKATHIHSVYESVATQLEKAHDESVDKFSFSGVIPNQKGYAKISGPLQWLSKSRLVIQTSLVEHTTNPLLARYNFFKVYIHDIGLLNTMLGVPITSYIQDHDLNHYKGFVVENYIAIELFARVHDALYSYKKNKTEIEFMLPHDKYGMIPFEVKSSARSRRSKSLTQYIKNFSPQKAYKITAQNYGYSKEAGFETIPHYMFGKLIDSLYEKKDL